MASLARWCFRHSFIVIGVWLVLLVSLFGLTKHLGSDYSNSFSLPNTDSTKALNLLKTVSPSASGETDTIVWKVSSGSVTNSATKQRINDLLHKVSTVSQVGSITSPYTALGARQISSNYKTAYAQISWTGEFQNLNKNNVKKVIADVKTANTKGLDVQIGGQAIEQSEQSSTSFSTGIGVLAAAVVLFIAFGSLIAMSVPLITTLIALGVGISAIGLLSHGLAISNFSPILGALIGLGVGTDYALFVITRHRSGLLSGLSPEEATVKSLNTAGRAVIFAGVTVCVALLGLLTLRLNFLSGIGIAAAIVVATTVLSSITLLPALLGIYKMKVLSRRSRAKLRKDGPIDEAKATGFWARNARFVENHPLPIATVALVIIFILAIPYFSLRLGSSDAGNDASTTTTRQAYDLLSTGFGPGFNGPLQLVAQVNTNGERIAFNNLVVAVKKLPGIAQVAEAPASQETKVGIIDVVPTTSPESKATSGLINKLRKNIIPTTEKNTGLHVYVGGITAIFNDFANVISGKLPLFLAVIIGLGFLILMVAFRSLVIPLTAAIMNLLAIGAAFGVLVAIFQWGWLSGILHTGGPGPVESFLPVIMIAILFGLSMDYQVFLVSRMHEEWVHTNDNNKAVRIGQTETGRVITAAATIMILVFLAFIFEGQRVIAEFGIGLAAAVFLDAFILRNFLVPAIMHKFGKANWWLPKWLDKILPHLAVEPVDNDNKKPKK
jgi:RND superfamily putative drug exporter